ncbi:MAG: DUF3048 domain-containing protein [Actinobacteria bacterium]|nr:DUF3048 domain-containing protein [Actinomycetota bacterium]
MKIGIPQKIAIVISLLVIIAGFYYISLISKNTFPYLKSKKEVLESTETTIEDLPKAFCPLCGVQVNENQVFKPIAVMIDNHNAALPHRGVNSACMIIETLAEGGITRLEAFYAHNHPKVVGPVRSARIYFVDFALSYKALLSHCGGSPEALSALFRLPIDLDQIRYSYPYFRDRSRRAPHNLYAQFDRFFTQAKNLGYDLTPVKEPFFMFGEETPISTTTVSKISVPFSSAAYTVSWIYDAQSDTFIRYTKKGKYVDELTNESPKVKNIVIVETKMGVKDNKGRLDIKISGKGKAWFIVGQYLAKGYWQKEIGKPFKFHRESGDEVVFKPGMIWIEILPEFSYPKFSN